MGRPVFAVDLKHFRREPLQIRIGAPGEGHDDGQVSDMHQAGGRPVDADFTGFGFAENLF